MGHAQMPERHRENLNMNKDEETEVTMLFKAECLYRTEFF